MNLYFDAEIGHQTKLQIDSNYVLANGSSISFQMLKFYISNIRFFHENKLVYSEKNSFHLIDFEDISTKIISLDKLVDTSFDQIKFDLGIDSTSNVSGALGGDLDPTKGMYWTWQSGYINCKMEAVLADFKNEKHPIEFHLGGYQYPFKSIQPVELNLFNTSNIHIVMELNNFVNAMDVGKQKRIMSPCPASVNISRQLAKCFVVK